MSKKKCQQGTYVAHTHARTNDEDNNKFDCYIATSTCTLNKKTRVDKTL